MGCGCGKAKKIVAGAAGVAKAALGIDKAAPEVAAARLDVCRECPQASKNGAAKFAKFKGLTTLSRCAACSCVIHLKVKVAGEKCPEGKW